MGAGVTHACQSPVFEFGRGALERLGGSGAPATAEAVACAATPRPRWTFVKLRKAALAFKALAGLAWTRDRAAVERALQEEQRKR